MAHGASPGLDDLPASPSVNGDRPEVHPAQPGRRRSRCPQPHVRHGVNPPCALPEGIGKCSANIYQVAGDQFEAAGLVANQSFGARFRIRTNVDPSNCKTGHLFLEAAGFVPPTTICRNGAVVGVGGVALGTPAVP